MTLGFAVPMRMDDSIPFPHYKWIKSKGVALSPVSQLIGS